MHGQTFLSDHLMRLRPFFFLFVSFCFVRSFILLFCYFFLLFFARSNLRFVRRAGRLPVITQRKGLGAKLMRFTFCARRRPLAARRYPSSSCRRSGGGGRLRETFTPTRERGRRTGGGAGGAVQMATVRHMHLPFSKKVRAGEEGNVKTGRRNSIKTL